MCQRSLYVRPNETSTYLPDNPIVFREREVDDHPIRPKFWSLRDYRLLGWRAIGPWEIVGIRPQFVRLVVVDVQRWQPWSAQVVANDREHRVDLRGRIARVGSRRRPVVFGSVCQHRVQQRLANPQIESLDQKEDNERVSTGHIRSKRGTRDDGYMRTGYIQTCH